MDPFDPGLTLSPTPLVPPRFRLRLLPLYVLEEVEQLLLTRATGGGLRCGPRGGLGG